LTVDFRNSEAHVESITARQLAFSVTESVVLPPLIGGHNMPQFMRLTLLPALRLSPLRWIGATIGAISVWSFLVWSIWQVFYGLF
jgi:hypothetical protein